MKGYMSFDRIAEIESAIIGLDIQIEDLQTRIEDLKDKLYLGVEKAYDDAVAAGDKAQASALSNEKKRKLKVKELLEKSDDYFELTQELDKQELEKLYLLVELGAEHRDFAIKYGAVPVRQIAKERKPWV